MFPLGYYRLVADINPVATMDEPGTDCNYTPYHIFVMETRLFPLLYKLYPDVSPTFESTYQNGRMEAYLVLRHQERSVDDFTINTPLEVSPENREIIQAKIRSIQNVDPDFALIDTEELYRCSDGKIPKRWFEQMIGYTGLDSSYNPYLGPEGIYLSFNPRSDYKAAYREVVDFIMRRIQEFYERGTFILANMERSVEKQRLVQNWELAPLDFNEQVNTIYQATWQDRRFAPDITQFLLTRILGEEYIQIWVGDNMVNRHAAAIGLKGYQHYFSGSNVHVRADTLQEAQLVATLVQMALAEASGEVLAIASHRLADTILYQKYAEKVFPDSESVIYKTSQGNDHDYIFSVILPNYVVSLEPLRQEFRQAAVDQLTNVSKISKFKNRSPHDIIEEEYGSLIYS